MNTHESFLSASHVRVSGCCSFTAAVILLLNLLFFVLWQKSRQHLRADLKLAASPCRGILWLQGGGPRRLPQTFHYGFQLAQTLLIMHGSDPLMLDATVYFPQDAPPLPPHLPAVHLVSDDECASVDRLQHALCLWAAPIIRMWCFMSSSCCSRSPAPWIHSRSVWNIWQLPQHLVGSGSKNTIMRSLAGQAETLAPQNKCSIFPR